MFGCQEVFIFEPRGFQLVALCSKLQDALTWLEDRLLQEVYLLLGCRVFDERLKALNSIVVVSCQLNCQWWDHHLDILVNVFVVDQLLCCINRSIGGRKIMNLVQLGD